MSTHSTSDPFLPSWVEESPLLEPAMPRRIDGHRVLVPLVRGTESSTFLAQASPDIAARLLMIARLDPMLSANPALVHVVERVADRGPPSPTLATPCVRRFDHGVYVVSDYKAGVSLEELRLLCDAAGIRIPTAVGLRILIDGLRLVQTAHEDLASLYPSTESVIPTPRFVGLSPRLLTVGLDGVVALQDFTIESAVLWAAPKSLRPPSFALGYAAPEQLWGTRAGRTADTWAAGVMAWEILSGKRLFPKALGLSSLVRLAQQGLPSLHAMAPGTPACVADVVTSATSFDPGARFESARALRCELAAACARTDCLAARGTVATFVTAVAGAALFERHRLARYVADLFDHLDDLEVLPPELTTDSVDTLPLPAQG